MSGRRGYPFWLVLLTGVLLVIGCYFLYNGAFNFLKSHGEFPIPQDTYQAVLAQTQASIPTLDIRLPTSTPARPCLDFRVNVIKARIRECPKDSCNTIDIVNQYTVLCVYGVATDAPDWYELNLSPNDPIPQLGYVHQSVVKAVKPTPRVTPTLDLPTVTPVRVTPTPATKPTS